MWRSKSPVQVSALLVVLFLAAAGGGYADGNTKTALVANWHERGLGEILAGWYVLGEFDAQQIN